MIVRIADIGPSGLIINDTISLQAINQRMQEGSNNDIEFIEAPALAVKIRRNPQGAEISGKAKTVYRQPCALCLRQLHRNLEVDLNFILKPKKDEEFEYSSEDFADDVGIVYFDGEHFNLEDLAQETLILALSPFLQPERDSRGCCLECGENPCKFLNSDASQGTSLADLLKKAGVGSN
jgi:uncharacterized metal-binding protein YceD (DUF177 family)